MEDRPNPDALLRQVERAEREKQEQCGKLKIFFGYAAGVGKTYAMLKAAHQARKEGADVVIGYTIEQMRFLVQSLNRIENPQDRAYLALHALHPLRLEEVLGLKEKDIDLIENTIHIERAAGAHQHRNPDCQRVWTKN